MSTKSQNGHWPSQNPPTNSKIPHRAPVFWFPEKDILTASMLLSTAGIASVGGLLVGLSSSLFLKDGTSPNTKYVQDLRRKSKYLKNSWSERIHEPQCALQHCLQQPRHRSNLNVHQGRNGYRRCGTYRQWNITQPWKRLKWWSNMNGPRNHHINWRQRKTNIIWYHLHVESKRKWHKLAYKAEGDSQI